MLLGEWWVANPTGAAEAYQPPEPAERVPGTLREVARGEFALETIGFLGDPPFMAGGPAASDRQRPDIWGTDRDATSYSLFDNLRSNSTWSSGHVSDGYEDWQVGWLAKGNAWVTSDEECSSARIQVDDLRAWSLYRQPNNIEFNDVRDTATIDFRKETLGNKMLGDTSVSLIRDSSYTFSSADQAPGRHFSYANVVYWKVEGPVGLRTIVEEWIDLFESFSRFMTMEPSVVSGIKCHLGDSGNRRLEVELISPRLPRDNQVTDRDDGQSTHKYLITLRALQDLSIDPMEILANYWQKVANGNAHMAMTLHLESQDGLLSSGADSALLDAVRSVESLYAAQNPGVRVDHVPVQDKIDDAVSCARDVGIQILDAWPELREIGRLRRDVAHGRGRPSASFGLRCLGGSIALQWIQRLRLLVELGIGEAAAHSIVSNSFQYPRYLQTLRDWSTELGAQPAR